MRPDGPPRRIARAVGCPVPLCNSGLIIHKSDDELLNLISSNVHAGFTLEPYAFLGKTLMRIGERVKDVFSQLNSVDNQMFVTLFDILFDKKAILD